MHPKTAEQLEAERMVRALYPMAPQHDDGAPDRPRTTPRARSGFSAGIWIRRRDRRGCSLPSARAALPLGLA